MTVKANKVLSESRGNVVQQCLNMKFKDKGLATELDALGYAVVDLLNESELQSVIQLYRSLNKFLPFNKDGVHITMEHSSVEFKLELHKNLSRDYYGILLRILDDFKIFQTSFIVKKKESFTNQIYPHQDWSFVDEEGGFRSYVVWIPLQDVTSDMGALSLYPGSHKSLKQIRYTPNEYFNGYDLIRAFASQNNFITVNLKAGQALIWDNRLIHFSAPNISSKDRANVSFGVTSYSNQLKLFLKSSENESILEYNVADDFYIRYNSALLFELYREKKCPENLRPIQVREL